MKTATTPLDLRDPRTLDEALAILAEDGPRTPIAGCTDVFVNLHFGTTPARRFLNLWALDELRGITADGTLRIGALTTYTELIRSEAVNDWLPALVAASREVGGAQIQKDDVSFVACGAKHGLLRRRSLHDVVPLVAQHRRKHVGSERLGVNQQDAHLRLPRSGP